MPHRLILILLVGLLCGAVTLPALADTGDTQKAQVTLLADTTAIAPGQTFTLGLLYQLEPEWHIYWRNPGDAGLPTTVAWKLPEQFKAGPLQYPLPQTFDTMGIMSYGYEGEALLLTQVTAPEDLQPGQRIDLLARTDFLICRDICLPGQAAVNLTLPTVASIEEAEPAHQEVFDTWRERLPLTGGEAAAVDIDVTGSLAGQGQQGSFAVVAELPDQATDVAWFPAGDRAVTISNLALETQPAQQGTTVHVTFDAAVYQGLELKDPVLTPLLVWTDEQGQRHGVQVQVPLLKAAAAPTPEPQRSADDA